MRSLLDRARAQMTEVRTWSLGVVESELKRSRAWKKASCAGTATFRSTRRKGTKRECAGRCGMSPSDHPEDGSRPMRMMRPQTAPSRLTSGASDSKD